MININQGYQLKSPVPSFTRDQVSWVSDLLSLSDNDYPDIYYIYCLEDRKRYKFDKNNSVDPLTGKCRLDEDARIDDILDDLDTKVDRGFNHTWTIRKNSMATEDGIKCSKILSLPEGQSIILNYSISEGPGGGHSGTLFFYTSTYNSCTTLESTGFTYRNTSWQSGGVSHRYFGYINQDSNYPYSNGTIKFQVVFCSCPMDQITWYDEAVSYNMTSDYKYASTIAYYPKPSSMYNAVQVIISNSDRLAGYAPINMESNVDFSIKKASDLPEGFYFKADPIDTTKMFRFAVDEVVNPLTVKDSGGNVLFSYEEDLYPGDILTAVPPLLEGDEWAISVDKSKIVSSDDSITIEDMEGRTDLTVTPRFHFITNSTANYPSLQTGTSVAFLAYKIYRHPTEWIQATMMITGDLSPLDESTMEQDQRVAEYLIPPLSDTRWGNKISATFQGSDRAMSNHFRYLVPNYLPEKNTSNPEYFIIGGTTGDSSFTAPFEYAASLISITPCAKIEEVNVLTQNYWNSYSGWECWRSNLLGTGIASSYGDSYLEDFLVSMAYCNGLVASLGSRIDGCMKFVGTKTEKELDSLTEPCCGFTNITIDNVSQGGVFMRMYTGVYSYIVFTNWNGITFQKRVGGTVWGTLRMSASDGTMNVVQDTNMGTVQLSLKATKGNSGTINFNGDSSTKKHLLLSFTGSNNNLLEENVSLLTQLKNYNGDVVTLLISHARIATYDTAPLRVQVLQGDKSLIEGKVNLYHRSSSAPEEYIVWEQAPNEDTWTILMNTLLSYNVREGRTEGLKNLYLANGEDVTSLLEGIPAPNTCYYYSYEPGLEEYQKITDNTLETTSNTVPGAVNEILGVVNTLKQRAYTLDFGTDSELVQLLVDDEITKIINLGALYKGIATPTTDPGTPDGKVFYIASESGTYTYFDNIALTNGQVAILKFNTNWDKELIKTSFINKYIPSAANEAVNAISELYLTGLDSNETYKVSSLKQSQNGYRLYIRNSSGVLVADVNDDGVYNKIQKIVPYPPSEISGYCIINTFHSISDIGNDITINNSVVSELDESPSIKMFLDKGRFNPNIKAGELIGTFSDTANIYSPNTNFIISSNGQETNAQNSILKCVKYLRIYGKEVLYEKRYAIRVLQRDTERTIRLALTEFGSASYIFDKTYTIPDGESIPQYLTIDFEEQPGSPFGVILTVDTSILVTNTQLNVTTGICQYYINPNNHINTICSSLDEQINGFWKIKEALGSKVNYSISIAEKWMIGNNYLSLIIPVVKGDKIFCIGNSAISTNFRLLADITSIPTSSLQPVSETGEIVLYKSISPNQEFSMVIPSGVKYVIFSLQYATSIRPFQKIKINDLIIPLDGDIKNSVVLERVDSEEEHIFDIASGSKNETCITDDSDNYNISYESVKGNQPISLCENENFVIVGHDDIPAEDYLVTRKIYNKYGFNGTFNYILTPFLSVENKNSFITNVRRLIKDGNHIGFHAIFFKSYFWRNPLFDITPNGSFTFAPILSELQGSNIDHTGTNAFGNNITPDTVFNNIGFATVPDTLSTLKVINSTSSDIFNLISAYSLFGATQNIKSVTGLDLEDQIVTKGELEWLEYWLNSLIDPSFGYSTISPDTSARYAADYSIPSGAVAEDYYPDINHLKNGKIVFYDEVNDEHYEEALIKTDPNFTENSYQLVGKFNKGLFKGCASCCNFEVIDRVIDIATAFVRKYIGVAQFDNMAYHGGGYVNCFWHDENGTLFGDRNKSIYATGFTPMYISHLRKFYNLFSLVKEKNIRTIKKLYPSDTSRVEGQIGFYKGQREFRGSDFNDVGPYDIGYYLALFGTTGTGQEMMSYETFIQYASHHKDWLIWACENANEYILGTSETYKVYSFVLDCIDAIRNSLGTGKLPFLGLDTIGNSPSVTAAIECVCRYCYENNIRIINMNDARIICNNKRNVSGNMFPNPSFNQSLYRMMNYTTLKEDIKRPDGWSKISGTPSFNVYSEGGIKILSLSGVSAGISTRIYGLPAGTYKFSAYIKCSSETSGSVLRLYKKYNKELVNSNPSLVLNEQIAVTSDTLIEQEFSIEEPFVNPIQNNKTSMFCGGYEDNVSYIRVDLMTNGITYLHSPSIIKIG